MKVISLGAGVQSTTLLLLANHGELAGPPVDCAIFADTGWEPAAVYEHLAWLESVSEIPILRVTRGDLRTAALDPDHRSASMPLFIVNQRGGTGRLHRQCTSEFKLEPIRWKLRELLGVGRKDRIAPGTVTSLLGLSLEEVGRMKPSQERWITIEWPLIEKRMTRNDCVNWLERHGYPIPAKSSCIGCPFHGNAYWRQMRSERPDEWADAIDFDERVRLPGHRAREAGSVGQRYLHRSMVPLRDVDLSNAADGGQGDLFDEECSGTCGV